MRETNRGGRPRKGGIRRNYRLTAAALVALEAVRIHHGLSSETAALERAAIEAARSITVPPPGQERRPC